MSEIPFTPERQRQLNKIKPENVGDAKMGGGVENVTPKQTKIKTMSRKVQSPRIEEKNDDLKQAEYLGDFFEKVVPVRIATKMIEDYKREVEQELAHKGIYKSRFDDTVEYKKAVEKVSDKIASGFKLFENKIYTRERDDYEKLIRGEASITEVVLNDVFEGKNIKFVLKEGDVAKKEYEGMLKFQKFLPNESPEVYEYIQLGNKGVLIMEKIEDDTMEQIFKTSDNVEKLLETKPKVFFDLGKIIAVMDNNNFIHGDLYGNNVLLSNEYFWKVIDFEFSKQFEGKKLISAKTFNVKQIDIDKYSDKFKNQKIKSDFYEGYLLNRNLKEDIRFILNKQKINISDTKKYVNGVIKMLKTISVPSEEIRTHFVSLISEIDLRLEELGEDKETKAYTKRIGVLNDFKNGIEKFLEKKTPDK